MSLQDEFQIEIHDSIGCIYGLGAATWRHSRARTLADGPRRLLGWPLPGFRSSSGQAKLWMSEREALHKSNAGHPEPLFSESRSAPRGSRWIPAFAGMTGDVFIQENFRGGCFDASAGAFPTLWRRRRRFVCSTSQATKTGMQSSYRLPQPPLVKGAPRQRRGIGSTSRGPRFAQQTLGLSLTHRRRVPPPILPRKRGRRDGAVRESLRQWRRLFACSAS